jgi:hypothetical protein
MNKRQRAAKLRRAKAHHETAKASSSRKVRDALERAR